MEKKTYIRPRAVMVRVEGTQILAGTVVEAPVSGSNNDLDKDDEGYGWAD